MTPHTRSFALILSLSFSLTHAALAAEPKTSSLLSRESETDTVTVGKDLQAQLLAFAADTTQAKKAVSGGKRPKSVALPSISKKELEAEGEIVTVEGSVGGRGYYGLAVNTERDAKKKLSTETWFNLAKGVKYVGVKSVMELQEDDKVRVVYKELKESRKKIVQKIELVQKAPPEPQILGDDELAAGGPHE